MSTEKQYRRLVAAASLQIKRNIIVMKPYLINIIRYAGKNLTERDANELIKKMVIEGSIDENLALSKNSRPYPFYVVARDELSFDKIIEPIRRALVESEELNIAEASKMTGYSPIVVRVLLTHLLLMGEIDYSGDMESPVFYLPWRRRI
jgi:hypothetical protein